MCATYSQEAPIRISGVQMHAQDDPHRQQEIILERKVLHKNNIIASHLRKHFEERQIFVVNLLSAPGAGKTSLLERTLALLPDAPIYIITADQETFKDAERIKKSGRPVIQINTGGTCHLDADMVHHAIHQLKPESESIVLIENIGGLTCPAQFDLGETRRVVMWSITDGYHVPIKYPAMFSSANLCLINKIDLLPYVDFNLERARISLSEVNPEMSVMELSITHDANLQDWIGWLQEHMPIHA